MRALLQRVTQASVSVDQQIIGSIQQGWLVLLGIHPQDTQQDIDYIIKKIVGLRMFSDAAGKFNLNLEQVQGQLLIVSQFTLYASTRKGNRLSFTQAAPPALAHSLYNDLCQQLQQQLGPQRVATGRFGADMQVSLTNSGPVTIMLDSQQPTS